MHLSRPPLAALRPFVELLWASDGGAPALAGMTRELVLPTGALHLVVRLDDRPLRLFRTVADTTGVTVSTAIVGGARAAPYVKDIAQPAATVGALLRPGAATLLFGAPAAAFTGAHHALGDVWGETAVEGLREQLVEAASPTRRLTVFEAALLARLRSVRRIDPHIAHAIARLRQDAPVG